MVTVKLHDSQGREDRVYDLKKFDAIGSDIDSGCVYLYKYGSNYTISCDASHAYIKIYGLPDYQKTGEKPHLEGLIYKFEKGKEYQLTEIFERLDNEPILIDYIKYRLFPGKFPNESTSQYLCG